MIPGTVSNNQELIEATSVGLAEIFGVPDEQDMRVISREQLNLLLDDCRMEGYNLGMDRAKAIIMRSSLYPETETFK